MAPEADPTTALLGAPLPADEEPELDAARVIEEALQAAELRAVAGVGAALPAPVQASAPLEPDGQLHLAPPPPAVDDLGIELLVETVKDGRLDPWDLDITEVTDRYLRRIDVMDHRNLAVSGRLFFYASVLLRLKAEYTARGFLSLQGGVPAFQEPDAEPLEEGLPPAPPTLEDPNQLRLPGMVVYPRAAGTRKRGLTLDDLISALRRCEELESRRERRRLRSGARHDAEEEAVIGTAHHDDLKADMSTLRSVVKTWPDESSKQVPFERLLCESLSPTTAYMALLFLAANREIELHQRIIYRELLVSRTKEFQHDLAY